MFGENLCKQSLRLLVVQIDKLLDNNIILFRITDFEMIFRFRIFFHAHFWKTTSHSFDNSQCKFTYICTHAHRELYGCVCVWLRVCKTLSISTFSIRSLIHRRKKIFMTAITIPKNWPKNSTHKEITAHTITIE